MEQRARERWLREQSQEQRQEYSVKPVWLLFDK